MEFTLPEIVQTICFDTQQECDTGEEIAAGRGGEITEECAEFTTLPPNALCLAIIDEGNIVCVL